MTWDWAPREDGWPKYADGISVEAIRELYEAALDSLEAGSHPGPCTNDDEPGEPCYLHVATSDARRLRVRDACEMLRRDLE